MLSGFREPCYRDAVGGKRPKKPRSSVLDDPVLAHFFRSSGVAMGVGEAESGRFLAANARLCELVGYTHDELIGRTAVELGIWHEVTSRAALVARVEVDGEVRDFAARMRTKAGDLRDVLITMTRLKLPDGRPINLATIADVTPLRSAERALARSETQFRTMLDHAPFGVFLTDAGGGTVYANRRHLSLLGLSFEEALGDGWLAAVPPEDRDAARASGASAVRQASSVEEQRRFRRRDGSECQARVRAIPLTEEGRFLGHVGFSEDVTERLRSEQALRQKQRVEAVGNLAGGVAHDFNNLLTVILAGAALAEGEVPEAHPVREALNDISLAARRAASLTRQLLAFARRQPVEPRIVDVNELVLNLDKMLRRLIGEDVELVTLPAPAAEPVLIDPGQMEQVLINLAVNARDAMPAGGTLTLAIGNTVFPQGAAPAPDMPSGVYVALTVQDAGRGMTPEVLAQCFEPFFSTKPHGEGTGLGLATVQSIVQAARGHVTIESAPGTGTTVRVLLPRAAAPPTPVSGVRIEELPRGTETILLVEDEPTVRGAAGRILQAFGYTVLTAADGSEGLRVASEQGTRIQLVVSDLVMPQMGGLEMGQRLRELRPDLPVLFTSGYVEQPVIEQVLKIPGSTFLAKPYLPADLLKRVRELLDQRLKA